MHPHYQERVQDNYCFRCMPQVQGVCRENLDYVKHLVEVEINAATDNPLIFPKGDGHYEFLSGGNFHGEPHRLRDGYPDDVPRRDRQRLRPPLLHDVRSYHQLRSASGARRRAPSA